MSIKIWRLAFKGGLPFCLWNHEIFFSTTLDGAVWGKLVSGFSCFISTYCTILKLFCIIAHFISFEKDFSLLISFILYIHFYSCGCQCLWLCFGIETHVVSLESKTAEEVCGLYASGDICLLQTFKNPPCL